MTSQQDYRENSAHCGYQRGDSPPSSRTYLDILKLCAAFAKLVPNTTQNDGPGFDHAVLDKKITKHFLRHERKASLEPSEDTPKDEKEEQQAAEDNADEETVDDTPAKEGDEPAQGEDEPDTDEQNTSFLDEDDNDDEDDDNDDDQNTSFLEEAVNDDDDDDDDE